MIELSSQLIYTYFGGVALLFFIIGYKSHRNKLVCNECGSNDVCIPNKLPILERVSKYRARIKANRAAKKGFLQKPVSERWWREDWIFYQPDSARPFYGHYVHRDDYQKINSGELDPPKCIDYTIAVRDAVLGEWGLKW